MAPIRCFLTRTLALSSRSFHEENPAAYSAEALTS
jgi:hypothetical protein